MVRRPIVIQRSAREYPSRQPMTQAILSMRRASATGSPFTQVRAAR